jgi:hypothetical protein
MANACKFIAAKLAASFLTLGLLVAPLCTIHCAAHDCGSESSTDNATPACHHQFAGHPVTGFTAQSCFGSCNPPELVLDLPRVEFQLTTSLVPHGATLGQLAVLFPATATNDTRNATPPGWPVLLLEQTSFEPRPPALLRR